MANETTPGFSMEVSGTSNQGTSKFRKGRKVKQEVGVGLAVVAVLIIVGFFVYWYIYRPEPSSYIPNQEQVTAPEVVSDTSDSLSVYDAIPSLESVVPDTGSGVPNPLSDVYQNPFN